MAKSDRLLGETSSYATHQWTPDDDRQWPVIYVLKTKNAYDLQLMGFPSIRAKAQNGFFLGGSWGLQGNVAAADILCAFRLAPSTGAASQELPEIFPMPSSDSMYRELLEAKRRCTGLGHSQKVGLDYVFDLTY